MSALAILIDCWDPMCFPENTSTEVKKNYQSIIDNIVNVCKTNLEISAVALAGYSFNTDANDTMFYDEEWKQNSDQWFVNETKWDSLRRGWKSIKWDSPSYNHESIRNMTLREDQQRFIAVNDSHIIYYCNYVNPSIDVIYFMGSDWKICVEKRPVGWVQLAGVKLHNLFVNDIDLKINRKCIWSSETKGFPVISDPWESTQTADVYQLNLNKFLAQ